MEIVEVDATTLQPTRRGQVARFTTSSGTGGERIRESDNHYIVNWHTKECQLDTRYRYRINVLVNNRVLGFADVQPVNNGKDLKNVDTNQFVALLSGQTLPIKFFLNMCCDAACPDTDACNVGACNPDTGACTVKPAANGTWCNDGNACTGKSSCQAGKCVGSMPKQCECSDQCRVGVCDPRTGACSTAPVADGTSCNDGNACTTGDTCQAGSCRGGTAVTCNSNDPCQVGGTCDPRTGACTTRPAPNGTACNDGNACTTGDTCHYGTCRGGTPVTCGSPGQCQTGGVCDPATGACSVVPAPNGTSCNDGNACTRADSCQNGACVGSNPVTCNSNDPCQVGGSCDPTTGACTTRPAPNGTSCNDGNACTRADSCQAGRCVGSNPVTCNSNDPCQVGGSCDPTTGACTTRPAADGTSCNDGNACTRADSCQAGRCVGSNPVTCNSNDPCQVGGSCDPTTGQCSTRPAADGTSCTDNNACTRADSCQAGRCVGSSPVTCSASDQCHTAGTCDPSTGACSNPVASNGTSCTDGNACTRADSCQNGTCVGSNPVVCNSNDPCQVGGSCDPTTGACSTRPAADGTSCNDSNACTRADSCQAGRCVGSSPVTCSASDQCHTAGTCDPSTGACSNPVAGNGTSCTDGNSCTQSDSCQNGACVGSNPVVCNSNDPCQVGGSCDPTTGACSTRPAADGTACNDSNACTRADSCQAGRCVGSSPVTCSASDQCHTAGTCDPSTGACSNPLAPAGTSCNDGNGCTRTDVCQNGACVGTSPVTCSASDQCHTAGTCNPSTGQCSNPNAPGGTACNDGNACTQSDSCQNGACVGSNPVTCNSNDPCQVGGTCDPTTGGCSTRPAPDGTSCNDGNACTRADSCQAGRCVGANPVVCSASDPCQVGGSCNPATGQCSTQPAPNGTACSDGNACTRSDTCQSGRCVGANPVVCSASDQCRAAGICNPANGTCSVQNAPDGTACTVGGLCNENGCTPGVCTSGGCIVPATCLALKRAYPTAPNGVYLIDPDGASGPTVPFYVYCDMVIDGGGWTLITSITFTGAMSSVRNNVLVEPGSPNLTNRNMHLPGVSEVLTVNDGQDVGIFVPQGSDVPMDLSTAFDKAEVYRGSIGLFSDEARSTPTVSWQQILDSLNIEAGYVWFNERFTRGIADNWTFDVDRVNDTGCLQVPLRGSYGDGNHGGMNSAGGPSGVNSTGALWHHWGGEIWVSGVNNSSALRCNQVNYSFTRFWKAVFLR